MFAEKNLKLISETRLLNNVKKCNNKCVDQQKNAEAANLSQQSDTITLARDRAGYETTQESDESDDHIAGIAILNKLTLVIC